MPQDEDNALVQNKGDLSISVNPILSNSPLYLQATVAYSPIQNVVLTSNITSNTNFQKYVLGGGYFRKVHAKDSVFLRFSGHFYYTWGCTERFKREFFGVAQNGQVDYNQYKGQGFVSLFGKHAELSLGLRGSMFDIKKIILSDSYTYDDVKNILDEEGKLIWEWSSKLTLKTEYINLYGGFTRGLKRREIPNPFYNNYSMYGGLQINLSQAFSD